MANVGATATTLGEVGSSALWQCQTAGGMSDINISSNPNAVVTPLSVTFTPGRRVVWGVYANVTLRSPQSTSGQALLQLNTADANGYSSSGVQAVIYAARRSLVFDAQFTLMPLLTYRCTLYVWNFDATGASTLTVDGAVWETFIFGRTIGTW